MQNSNGLGDKILEHLARHQKKYLIILFLILLISPYLVRYLGGNYTIIGEPSYFYLKAAEGINEDNFYQNPYHSLLSLNFSGNLFIYQIIPLILGVASLLLLFSLAAKFKVNKKKKFFFFLFLVISPAFIYTFTVLNHYSLVIFLNLLGLAMLSRKEKIIKYSSLIAFGLIPFLDIFSSILTLCLLAAYLYLKKEETTKIIGGLVIALTIFNIFLGKPFFLGPYVQQNALADFFSDWGSSFGLSLFAMLLAGFGLAFTWKEKKAYLVYILIALFLVFSFYQTKALIYLNFLIIGLAAFGFNDLLKKEWKLKVIKNMTLFLLILGFIFSTLSYLDKLSSSSPLIETKDSLTWLREKAPVYKKIFSDPGDSYMVEYFSKKPAFIRYDEPDFKTKSKIKDQIYQSSYIKTTFPLLEENEISHIFISAKAKMNLPNQGLRFVLQNERFKKIYDKEGVEIWEVLKE